MKWCAFLSGFVVTVLAAGPARAQEPSALRLTLDDAQRLAVEASHRLAEGRARVEAAESSVEVRRAAELPVLSAQAGYTRTNHVPNFVVPSPTGLLVIYPDVPNNYRTRLDLQWPIYSGGRTDALRRAASADAAAAGADLAAARGDLRLEVARSFWALVTARAAMVVVEQGLARSQAHLNDVRQRFAVGLVPPNEVASAEAQESRQRMLLIEARNLQEQSSAELRRLIGGEPTGPVIEPVASLDVPVDIPADGDLVALVGEALVAREDRRALQQRVTAVDEQQAAVRAGARPMVAVTGGVDYARPNPRIFPRAPRWEESWDAGISVSWSLWDGGRIRSEAAATGALATAARRRIDEFDSVLRLEIRQRLLDIDSGTAAVAAAADAIRAATEARRVIGERYEAGVAIQSDLLEADVVLLQAELDRTRALAGVRLAEARLARALGR